MKSLFAVLILALVAPTALLATQRDPNVGVGTAYANTSDHAGDVLVQIDKDAAYTVWESLDIEPFKLDRNLEVKKRSDVTCSRMFFDSKDGVKVQYGCSITIQKK